MILFGTGGIRGIMRKGEFDEEVVIKASKAFGEYILRNEGPKEVVIAYDTRKNSRYFAELSARVLAGMGLNALMFENDVPTPVLSFACRKMNSYGVVITASHNPPEYNGYKIYTPNGVQAVPEVTDVVSKLFLKQDCRYESGKYDLLTSDIEKEYIERVVETVGKPSRRVRIAYSPLHGTGRRFVPEVLKELDVEFKVVEEQMKADGDFSTVRVPNPEEDEALEMLKRNMLDLEAGLATDPDSDRLGVVIKKGDNIVRLTGNQLGVLLTDFLTSKELPENPYVVKTIVTTDMIKPMGEERGFEVVETPTGFKFIGDLIVKRENEGRRGFVFAFEESYGYLSGDIARDKDGVLASALTVVAMSEFDFSARLEELYECYGYHVEKLVNITFDSPERAREIYEKVKEKPEMYFDDIEKTVDYSKGVDGIRPNETLCVILKHGKIFLRPSGTEPKLKAYLMTIGKSRKDAESRMRKLEVVIRDVASRTRS